MLWVFIKSISLLAVCLLIMGCHSASTDTNSTPPLSEIIPNNTWYNNNQSAESSLLRYLYLRHDFRDSLVTTEILPFPCGFKVDWYGIDDTVRSYRVIDNEKIIIGKEEFQVEGYNKNAISLKLRVNNLDSILTLEKRCSEL